ncbi:MAG TPA: RNA-binding protein [Chitinophagaceae bacterium]|jgi:RNA recognition motif-containing protein|nr:RNA-binding protein [Chitinophagaceae bacterium]
MNMYVSNLGYQTSEDDLRRLFEAFGQVTSAKVITDRETGKSRGFGFVEMPAGAEANEAMSKLNGKEVEGRTISVTVAREKESRPDKKRW